MRRILPYLAIVALILGCSVQTKPPIAPKRPLEAGKFGLEIRDNYHWMKDRSRSNEEVLSHIRAENSYTDTVMKEQEGLVSALYEEMKARVSPDDLNVPERIGDYFYYYKEQKDKEYRVYCRKKGSLEAEEEIILDVNILAEGSGYFELSQMSISPDHSKVAYLADNEGNEFYHLFVKDLESGKNLNEDIYPVGDMVWASDDSMLYTLTDTVSNRSDKVFIHYLGKEDDKELYHEEEEGFYVGVSRTRDHRFLIISSFSHTTSKILISYADKICFREFTSSENKHMYYPDSHGDLFYVWTNSDNARDFKIVTCPTDKTDKKYWTDFIPAETGVEKDFTLFKDYLVLSETVESNERLKILNFKSGEWSEVPLGEPPYAIYQHRNPEFESQKLRFSYVSMVKQYTVMDYDMKTGETEIKKEQEVIGGYDPDLYHQERIYAVANDGETIPVSVVYRKDKFKGDGSNPLWVYGYGAYGDSSTDYFSSARLTLLDRGWVYAAAHVRGGGEKGKKWHDQGRMEFKENTFTDFISVVEYLHKKKHSTPANTVINGVSAGGLMIGSVINMRPDIADIAILEVPFVDVLNTMQDPSLSGVVAEYEEWGNPENREDYLRIASYCPYTNIKKQEYPNILVTAGLNDMRVNYWEALKYVAKLREMKQGESSLLLKVKMSGHFGDSGRYEYYRDLAYVYGFVFSQLERN